MIEELFELGFTLRGQVEPIKPIEEKLCPDGFQDHSVQTETVSMEWVMSDNAVVVHGVYKMEWFCVYYSYGAN